MGSSRRCYAVFVQECLEVSLMKWWKRSKERQELKQCRVGRDGGDRKKGSEG